MISAEHVLYALSGDHNGTIGRRIVAKLQPPSRFGELLIAAWRQADIGNHVQLMTAFPEAGAIMDAHRRGGLDEAWKVYWAREKVEA